MTFEMERFRLCFNISSRLKLNFPHGRILLPLFRFSFGFKKKKIPFHLGPSLIMQETLKLGQLFRGIHRQLCVTILCLSLLTSPFSGGGAPSLFLYRHFNKSFREEQKKMISKHFLELQRSNSDGKGLIRKQIINQSFSPLLSVQASRRQFDFIFKRLKKRKAHFTI